MENIYKDIADRTGGNVYLGVVGPVRTGKSAFIKSFMENMVLPNIEDVYLKERAKDELPQSGSGRTVMTAEPKFVPEDAVKIKIDDTMSCSVRLIDCVGYMIESAAGMLEDGSPRMVATPWSESEMPLSEAAEIGTNKVIRDHSTIGVLVTADGSFGDIKREDYVKAEERVVSELKEIGKPFCVILNSKEPESASAQELRQSLEDKYKVPCIALNCLKTGKDEIESVLSALLYQFPVREFSFDVPDWLLYLPEDNKIRKSVFSRIFEACDKASLLYDAVPAVASVYDGETVERSETLEIDLGKGNVYSKIELPKKLFYDILSEYSGMEIENDGALMKAMCEMSDMKREYSRVSNALSSARQTGYGIVMPEPGELEFKEPEIVKQGGRFGVRLKAEAPSIHLIRADIETEINPIVGSEKQSEDLVKYLLSEFEDSPEKIWETDIFGKSLSELVNEGLNNKLYKMPDEAREKFRTTLERAINEGSGGLICIIL